MSRQRLLPPALGRVHPRRRTPHIAILVLMGVVIMLALTGGGVAQLASATSLLLLTSFCVVNAALVVLKFRASEPRGYFEVPAVVPALGVVVCAALVYSRVTAENAGWQAPAIAGGLVCLILLAYALYRPATITEEALAEAEHEHG